MLCFFTACLHQIQYLFFHVLILHSAMFVNVCEDVGCAAQRREAARRRTPCRMEGAAERRRGLEAHSAHAAATQVASTARTVQKKIKKLFLPQMLAC